MRPILLLSLVLFGLSVVAEDAKPLQVASGSIVRLADFESRHVPARNVDVWLPEGYPKARPYAVLYMHDGQMLFDGSRTWNKQEWQVDEVAGTLIADHKVRPFIVVGIANIEQRRHSEYFPQKAFVLLPEARQQALLALERGGNKLFTAGVVSDAYLKFVVTELKPHIDANFAVDPKPTATAIMGSSMGGLISIYALSEYPQVFGSMAALSTHWPGAFSANDESFPQAMREYLAKKLPKAGTHRLYFDHGTATLDAWYPPLQEKVDALVAEKGYDDRAWQSRVYPGAEHSEKAWAYRLDVPLQFLFPPAATPQGD